MEPPKKRKFLSGGDESFVVAASNRIDAYNGVGLEAVRVARNHKFSVNNKAPIQSFMCNSTLPDQKSRIINQNFQNQQETYKSDGEDHDIVASSEGGGVEPGGGTGSNLETPARRNRRKYSVEFKVSVLEGYYNDAETRGNQRKTAIKYGVNRRQIQKWLAQESQLREQNSNNSDKNMSENLSKCLKSPQVTITQLTPVKRLTSELKKDPAGMTQVSRSTDPSRMTQTNKYFQQSPAKVHSAAILTIKSPENPYKRKSEDGVAKHLLAELPPSRPATLRPCSRPATLTACRSLAAKQLSSSFENASGVKMSGGVGSSSFSSQSCEARVEIKEEPIDMDDIKTMASEEPMNLSKDFNQTVPKSTMARSHPDPLSTHILDTGTGKPAHNVQVNFYRMGGGSSDNPTWMKVHEKRTNEDGRASGFLTWESFYPGTYKLHFNTGEYYAKTNTSTFYPFAEVVFQISDPTLHYHVPLLLSPFSYSTYRGS